MKKHLNSALLILATVFFLLLTSPCVIATSVIGASIYFGVCDFETVAYFIMLVVIGTLFLSTALCCINMLWQRFRNRKLIHLPMLPATCLLFFIMVFIPHVLMGSEIMDYHKQCIILSISLSIIAICGTIFYTTNLYCKQEEVSEGRRTNSEGRSAK